MISLVTKFEGKNTKDNLPNTRSLNSFQLECYKKDAAPLEEAGSLTSWKGAKVKKVPIKKLTENSPLANIFFQYPPKWCWRLPVCCWGSWSLSAWDESFLRKGLYSNRGGRLTPLTIIGLFWIILVLVIGGNRFFNRATRAIYIWYKNPFIWRVLPVTI